LSGNKTNYNRDVNLPMTSEKMSPHYLVKCRTHSSGEGYIASLRMLMALKRESCVVWQLECQESNVLERGRLLLSVALTPLARSNAHDDH